MQNLQNNTQQYSLGGNGYSKSNNAIKAYEMEKTISKFVKEDKVE